MKTKKIEARRIGWIVEDRETKHDKWNICPWTFDKNSKLGARMKFERSCRSGYCYRGEAQRGLARCVAVYVEVKP